MSQPDYLQNLNNLFVELTSNYLETSNSLMQYLNDQNINPDPLFSNNIIQVEASFNDLLINLQNLQFTLKSFINKSNFDKDIGNSGSVINVPLNSDMDRLINKAIKDMMPMMMMHLMQIDPDSILNKPIPQNNDIINDKQSGPYDVD